MASKRGIQLPRRYDHSQNPAPDPNIGGRNHMNQNMLNPSSLGQSPLNLASNRALRNQIAANRMLMNQPINSQVMANLDWTALQQSDGNQGSMDLNRLLTNQSTNYQSTTNPNQILMNQYVSDPDTKDPSLLFQNDRSLAAEIAQGFSLPGNMFKVPIGDGKDGEDPDNEAGNDKRLDLKKKRIYKSREQPAVNPLSVPRMKEPVFTAAQRRDRDFHAKRNAEEIEMFSKINETQIWENQEWEVSDDEEDYAGEEIVQEPDDKQLPMEIPIGMAMTAKGQIVQANGRVKGRKLVLWHRPRMIDKLILHLQYELHRRGVDIPWNHIVHRMSPGSSGQTATQHLNKMRDLLIAEGHMVPPLCGKVSNPQDPNIRGYIRDMTAPNVTTPRIVYWNEIIEDRKESLEVPGLVRGSGNYRKTPGGQGLDRTTKAEPGTRRSRLPPVTYAEQEIESPRNRKRAAPSGDDDEEAPSFKRTRSGRILRSSLKIRENNVKEETHLNEPKYTEVPRLPISSELTDSLLLGNHHDEDDSVKMDEESDSEYVDVDDEDSPFDYIETTERSRDSVSVGVAQNLQQTNPRSAPPTYRPTPHHNGSQAAVHGNNISQSYQQQVRDGTGLQAGQYFDPAVYFNSGVRNPMYSNNDGRAQPQRQNVQSDLSNGIMQHQASDMQNYGSHGFGFSQQNGGGMLQPQMPQAQPMAMQDDNVNFHDFDAPFGLHTNAMDSSAPLQPLDLDNAYGAPLDLFDAPSALFQQDPFVDAPQGYDDDGHEIEPEFNSFAAEMLDDAEFLGNEGATEDQVDDLLGQGFQTDWPQSQFNNTNNRYDLIPGNETNFSMQGNFQL